MKISKAAEILRDDYTTCVVLFKENGGSQYTYKIHKDWLDYVKVGDYVVVRSLYNLPFALVKILEIHDEPMIDFDSTTTYQWVADVFNQDHLDEQENQDMEIQKQVKAAAVKKAKQAMIAELSSELGLSLTHEESKEVKES